jgi:hypothetical protein
MSWEEKRDAFVARSFTGMFIAWLLIVGMVVGILWMYQSVFNTSSNIIFGCAIMFGIPVLYLGLRIFQSKFSSQLVMSLRKTANEDQLKEVLFGNRFRPVIIFSIILGLIVIFGSNAYS